MVNSLLNAASVQLFGNTEKQQLVDFKMNLTSDHRLTKRDELCNSEWELKFNFKRNPQFSSFRVLSSLIRDWRGTGVSVNDC